MKATRIPTYTIFDMEDSVVEGNFSREEVIQYLEDCVESGNNPKNIFIVETSNILQPKASYSF